ncbi:MAG TPA: M23 family metallopeptidase [Candidatus Paceibacterota bacterium]|nr:M23 family metallopeptidase [Candidatus Paceibacterota bacterium]
MKLSLYYPVYPHIVTDAWGVEDPRYERFGFTHHNGIDIAAPAGEAIHAPYAARVRQVSTGEDPRDLHITLLAPHAYEFPDTKCHVEITFMHVLLAIVLPGEQVAAGELIGFAGGNPLADYIHMAPKRVRAEGRQRFVDVDLNHASGTFDPLPYWNERYAQDLDSDGAKTLARLQRTLTNIERSLAEDVLS